MQLKLETLQATPTVEKLFAMDLGLGRGKSQIKAELLKLLKAKPLKAMDSSECVRPFCLMAATARNYGILPLMEMLRPDQDPFFVNALLSIRNTHPEVLRISLEQQVVRAVQSEENLLEVLLQAVMNIQMGYDPKLQKMLVKHRLG